MADKFVLCVLCVSSEKSERMENQQRCDMNHDEWVKSELEAFSKAHGFIYTPLREIETRLGRLRKYMEELEIEGILAAEKMDCFYFSGTAQDALLFIPWE